MSLKKRQNSLKQGCVSHMAEGPIIIIEDDEAMLTLLAEFFNSMGHNVLQYRSAIQAVRELEALSETFIQAVISDINMPVMNGIELLQWVQERFSAPVILISAFGNSDLEQQALEAGASFFMKKPFALSALKKAVDSVVMTAS